MAGRSGAVRGQNIHHHYIDTTGSIIYSQPMGRYGGKAECSCRIHPGEDLDIASSPVGSYEAVRELVGPVAPAE